MTPAPKPLDADRPYKEASELERAIRVCEAYHTVHWDKDGHHYCDFCDQRLPSPGHSADCEPGKAFAKLRHEIEQQLAQAAERVTCACGHEFEPGDFCQGCSQAAYDQACRAQAAEREGRVAELVEAVSDLISQGWFSEPDSEEDTFSTAAVGSVLRAEQALAALAPTEKNDAE